MQGKRSATTFATILASAATPNLYQHVFRPRHLSESAYVWMARRGTAWLVQQWNPGTRFALLDKPDSGTPESPTPEAIYYPLATSY